MKINSMESWGNWLPWPICNNRHQIDLPHRRNYQGHSILAWKYPPGVHQPSYSYLNNSPSRNNGANHLQIQNNPMELQDCRLTWPICNNHHWIDLAHRCNYQGYSIPARKYFPGVRQPSCSYLNNSPSRNIGMNQLN